MLRDTVAHCGAAATAAERTAAVSAARELRLVQNQGPIVAPPREFGAEAVDGGGSAGGAEAAAAESDAAAANGAAAAANARG